MKSILLSLVFILAFSAHANRKYPHPHQLVVKADDSILSNKSLGLDFSLKQLSNHNDKSDRQVYLLELNNLVLASEVLKEVESLSSVSWAAPNYIYEGEYREFTPNDKEFEKQHHHKMIESEKAWDVTLGKEEVIVAVTDDGFRLKHSDLEDAWWENPREIPGNKIDDDGNGYVDDVLGWNFNNNNNDPDSDYNHGGHGTHVAGIVGATFNNKRGVTGMSPYIKVMPLKFYGSVRWSSSMVFETYAYAVDNGAKIISTSYNIDSLVNDLTYRKALDYAYDKNVIVFNSAGNSGKEEPARVVLDKIILVGSVQSGDKIKKHDKISRYSNYGLGVDIFAPGDPIHSTYRSGRRTNRSYGPMSGTSMAAPVVAGLAAYIWSAMPELTMDQVLAKVMMGAIDIEAKNRSYKNKLGNGRINSFHSIATDLPKAPFIKKVWYDKKSKDLKILVQGVLDRHEIKNSQIIIEGEGDTQELQVNNYELGTNVLKFKFDLKGNHEVVLRDGMLKDPFGQSLDGNGDGMPGGEFRYNFKVN